MIPLKDNIPTRRFPVVSVSLIVINVVAFAIDQLTGGHQRELVQTPYGEVILQHPEFVGGLTHSYSLVPAALTHNPSQAWFTIFTSMFLHSNLLHVGGNMLYLWIFGNNVEDSLGRGRFLLFYLACGVAAAAAQVFQNPNETIPMIGASGAVAGLMAAYLILFPGAQILSIVPIFFVGMITEVPAVLVIGLWIVVQFFNARFMGGGGLLHGGGVAYYAHVGGFLAGLVLILLLGGRTLAEQRDERRWDNYYR